MDEIESKHMGQAPEKGLGEPCLYLGGLTQWNRILVKARAQTPLLETCVQSVSQHQMVYLDIHAILLRIS